MNETADVVVAGAGGKTGRALIANLLRRGVRVRAIVRREAQRESFPEAVDVRIADLADRASLGRAIAGASVVHYVPPLFNPAEEAFAANLIGAVLDTDGQRLCYHSVLHSPTPAMPHHIRKSRVELALRESPLAWTIVQPAMYVQTPIAFLDAEQTKFHVGFHLDRRFSPIDITDLSEAVANILTEDGHEFATYELAGPDRIDGHGMAATFSEILGRPISARKVDPVELVARRAEALALSEQAAGELRAMLDHYDAHGLVGNANIARMLLRREPLSFRDAASRDLTGT